MEMILTGDRSGRRGLPFWVGGPCGAERPVAGQGAPDRRTCCGQRTLAIRNAKASVINSGWIDEEDARKVEQRLVVEVMRSEDAKKGLAAFAAKREPASPVSNVRADSAAGVVGRTPTVYRPTQSALEPGTVTPALQRSKDATLATAARCSLTRSATTSATIRERCPRDCTWPACITPGAFTAIRNVTALPSEVKRARRPSLSGEDAERGRDGVVISLNKLNTYIPGWTGE